MPRHDDPTEITPRPRPASDRGPGATTSQLRRDIDSGATGDKVPVIDPASSPLGTDDEAAAAPPTPELVAQVRNAERADRIAPRHPADRPEDRYGYRLIGGLVLAVILAAVALWLSFA